jgi:hypothetical protein
MTRGELTGLYSRPFVVCHSAVVTLPERAVVLENSMGNNALHHDSRNHNKKEKASVIER